MDACEAAKHKALNYSLHYYWSLVKARAILLSAVSIVIESLASFFFFGKIFPKVLN